MDGEGADLFGGDHAETAAFDHGGATHADRRPLDPDGNVAAAEECGVPSEAPPGRDSNGGNRPRQRCEGSEGFGIETSDHGVIGIARSTAPTFGEEHDGEVLTSDEVEEAILFLVVALPLGASEHRCVVGEDGNWTPVDRCSSGDEAVGRRGRNQLLSGATPRLCGVGEPAVLDQ